MDKIRTFDLLVFDGDELISKIISTSEAMIENNGNVSHVGMVLEGKHLPKLLDPTKLYIWESTISSDAPDVITGKYLKGVQIRELSVVVSKYSGKVGCHRLLQEISEETKIEMVPVLYEKYKNVKYVNNPFVLISALFCCLRPCISAKHSGMFCSEFVGTIYKHLGIIDINFRTETIVPVDFTGIDADGMEKTVRDSKIDLKS